MAKNLGNTAFLIIKLEFYCHFDFANPQSRGVCWGKNFLQNDFCRDKFNFRLTSESEPPVKLVVCSCPIRADYLW